MTSDSRRAAFAAEVANARSIAEIIDEPTGRELLAEFRTVLGDLLGPGAPANVRRDAIPDDEGLRRELVTFQERIVDVLANLLPFALFPSRPSGSSVPIGIDYYLPVGYRLLLRVHRRTLRAEIVSSESNNLASALLASLFEDGRRVPLWGCRGCARVFAVSRIGRSRAFCSTKCKQAKIPSKSKRSEYQQRYRERVRQRQLERATEVIRSEPSSDPVQALTAAFPGRPRRWVINLIDEARRELRTRQEGGR
jgi:hypothetical protein